METLDPGDQALLCRASRLSREAELVLVDLGLPNQFESLGQAIRIGSMSFGLALLPDIDLGTLCPALDAGTIWNALRSLAEHVNVKKLRWSDQRGTFNATDEPQDEGIYCGIHYFAGGTKRGQHWKIDCWFFPGTAPRPEIPLRDRLIAASADERLAILRLKDAAIQDGRYGPTGDIHGVQIYEAVLDRGIRRYEDLASLVSR